MGARGGGRIEVTVTDSAGIAHRFLTRFFKVSGAAKGALGYSIRKENATGSFIFNRHGPKALAGLALAALLASGCGSVHAGWPGVPVSVGIPLRGLSEPRPFTLALALETEPAGADILLDGSFVGTTPTVVHMVFKRSFTGSCYAEPVHRLLVTKPGFRPHGLSYTCQLAWDLSEGPASGRRLTARIGLEPDW